jgi:hypothetical protein
VDLLIPEPPSTHTGAELFLKPEEIIFHNQPLLRYQIKINIVELHDWHDPSSSSDDFGDYPDPQFNDSDDDYPGVNENTRSKPWPKVTKFPLLGLSLNMLN